MKQRIELDKGWQLESPTGTHSGDEWLDISVMPAQVHEILYDHGLIGEEFAIGIGENIKWVAERDWTYRCQFEAGERSDRAYLHFCSLDTLVDVYLNGRHIAYSRSQFLPLRVEVTGLLQEQNLLELKFHSPHRYIEDNPLPPEWEDRVRPCKIIRKSIHDFSDYLGARPYITPMGISWSVFLEKTDNAEIERCDVITTLSSGYKSGAVLINAFVPDVPGLSGLAVLFDPEGKKTGECELISGASNTELSGSIAVDEPELWWPIGYGEQPLYTVEVTLCQNGTAVDCCKKQIGMRDLHTNINFELTVNGRRIRLWGSNIPPFDGKTRRWNGERVNTLLDFVENGNMNTLRIWGEGDPVDDRFYEECDRRGILIWQEFFNGYGNQPDTREYFDLCLKEGEYLVNRLKHHPCIFMWCGGNECYMGNEFENPGKEPIGTEIYVKDYPALIERLDPGRYFHISSPWGGEYTNDPCFGDTHGYEMWWYNPGWEYPVAFSEHMRVSGAAVKSLKRFIPENEFWPSDFVDSTAYSRKNNDLMPKAWAYRAGGMLALKAGPVNLFRDADSPEEMTYKYSAAHAYSFKRGIERCRMGRPSGGDGRISNCHLIWKLSDTWPLIYSAIIDYYLEPFLPYYAAKRGYSPVMACFDVRDHINIWLVNDSPEDTNGTLFFGLFNPGRNEFIKTRELEVCMPAGQSGEVLNLDFLGQFRIENFLYVRYEDKKRGILYTNNELMDTERRLLFPEAKLSMSVSGDTLCITTDCYAHCVELTGNDNGDEFGWYFGDNFFNLLPGEEKLVKIGGRHKQGEVSAKAHYSPYTTSICYK